MTTKIAVSPAVETLTRAREILEQQGWCQGAYEDPRTYAHCLVGAVRAAIGPVGYNDVCALLCRAVGIAPRAGMCGCVDSYVIRWNDDRGRTKAEVIAALDRAIALGLGLP